MSSRCYQCCQENCGYTGCMCPCHPYVAPAKKPAVELDSRSAVKAKLGSRVMTAGEIAKALSKPVASVSSLLRKMVDDGDILRVDGFGARGGYGYLLKRDEVPT